MSGFLQTVWTRTPLRRSLQSLRRVVYSMPDSCVFCEIVAGKSPADVVLNTPDVLGIVPLNPVTPGHVIFIPKVHVAGATDDPSVTAYTMKAASMYGKDKASSGSMNLITSVGVEATQSVFHLHIHLVPRRHCDLLPLPWTPVQTVASSYQSLQPDGHIWCQSHSPGEVIKMSTGYPGQLTFQKFVYTRSEGQWVPWDIA